METKSSNKINYTVNFEENLEEKLPDFKIDRLSKKTNKIEPACNIPSVAAVTAGKKNISIGTLISEEKDKLLIHHKESCCSHLCKALPLIG